MAQLFNLYAAVFCDTIGLRAELRDGLLEKPLLLQDRRDIIEKTLTIRECGVQQCHATVVVLFRCGLQRLEEIRDGLRGGAKYLQITRLKAGMPQAMIQKTAFEIACFLGFQGQSQLCGEFFEFVARRLHHVVVIRQDPHQSTCRRQRRDHVREPQQIRFFRSQPIPLFERLSNAYWLRSVTT